LNLQGDDAIATMHRKMHYFEEIVVQTGISLIPGARDLVKELQASGILLGLATSSRLPKMNLVMQQTGLFSFFHTIVTGEMVEQGKPSPDIFLLVAEKIGINPSDCVVVEDAVHGVRAARAAGMKSVAIVSTHKEHELKEADLVINRYSELSAGILEGLFVPA